MYRGNHISVIVPAHNEALSIALVLQDLFNLVESTVDIIDHVVVCDNASSDATAKLAIANGAEVVHESQPGYGSACQKALKSLNQTDIVVFVDGDASVKVSELPSLLDAIIAGADLVIGVRENTLQEPGGLHWQQRLGTQLACRFMSLLYKVQVSDLGPFRAIKYAHLLKMDMQDQRFGWTAEMQAKAIQNGLMITESPVSVRQRIGKSKISGTLRGTVLAGYDIFSSIWTHWRANKNDAIKR